MATKRGKGGGKRKGRRDALEEVASPPPAPTTWETSSAVLRIGGIEVPIVKLTLGILERPQATRVRPAGPYTSADSIAVLRVREACRRAD